LKGQVLSQQLLDSLFSIYEDLLGKPLLLHEFNFPSKTQTVSLEIFLDRILFIIFAMTFEIILYRQLHKEIGKKSSRDDGLSILGIRSIKV
jgi:hypothetical protein